MLVGADENGKKIEHVSFEKLIGTHSIERRERDGRTFPR
jgi:hypothetical protein